MHATINLNDELIAEARALTGIAGTAELIHEALRALIARESARRLARLGGSARDIGDPPRRRRLPHRP